MKLVKYWLYYHIFEKQNTKQNYKFSSSNNEILNNKTIQILLRSSFLFYSIREREHFYFLNFSKLTNIPVLLHQMP